MEVHLQQILCGLALKEYCVFQGYGVGSQRKIIEKIKALELESVVIVEKKLNSGSELLAELRVISQKRKKKAGVGIGNQSKKSEVFDTIHSIISICKSIFCP